MMRIPHPPCDVRAFRGLAAVAMIAAVGATAACQVPRPAPVEPPAQTAEEPSGLDARATLTLDEIQPPPPMPSGGTTTQPAVPRATDDLLGRARELEHESRYTEAAIELEKGLADAPSSILIRSTLARLYALSGTEDRARAYARLAVEARPDDGIAHYVLAMLAVAGGKPEEAIREFRIALLCPDVAGQPARAALAHYRLALLLEGEGYFAAALAEQRAYESRLADVTEDPPSDPELAKIVQVNGRTAAEPIARLCERLGRDDEAADALARMLDRERPDEPAVRARYARILARSGRFDAALAQARAIQGDTRLRVALLSEIHAGAGQPRQAIQDFEQLRRDDPDDPVLADALADAYAEAGRWTEAVLVLRTFAEAHPDSPDAAWLLYEFLVRRAKWCAAVDAAAEQLARRLDSFPSARARMTELASHPGAVAAVLEADRVPGGEVSAAREYLVGCIAADAGDRDTAWSRLERSLKHAPGFAGPRIELGRILLKEYRWDDAIQFAQTSGEPHPQLERILGDACAGLDDFEQAVEHYTRAIRENRSDVATMRTLAALFERDDEPLQARREYELLLRENPWDAEARAALATLYLQAGERAAAVQQANTLRRMAAPAQILARVEARLAFQPQQPDHERFRRMLLDAVGDDPMEPETAYLLASSFIAERDFDAAEPYVQRGLAGDPDQQDLLELDIWILRHRLEFAEAERRLRRLVKRWPNRTLWLNHLLHTLLVQQKHEDVITLAQFMLTRNSLDREDRQRCRVELVDALRAMGRADEAVELASRWCVDEPDNSALRALLITTMLREGRRDAALTTARRWYDESDGQTEREVLLEVLTESKQYDRAAQYLLGWLQKDPLNDDLLADLIFTLIAAERFDDALELAEANYDRPGSRITYELAALQAYNAAGRLDDTIRLLRQWIYRSERGLSTEFPLDLPQARRFLVLALMAQDRINDARKNLNRWLDQERNPLNKVSYLTLLSECDRRAGRLEQSFESLELAHSLNPLDVNTCNSLGYTWADAGRRLEEAEAMIRYAVANEPRNAAFLDSLGWVLYKKGDHTGAVYWLELARGADATGDAVILDHLGDAYWRSGNSKAAVVEWRAAANAARRMVDEEKSDDPSHLEVLERTPTKIEAASKGEQPPVAPIGSAGEQE